MAETIRSFYFESSGEPATGLSPTCSVKDATTNKMVLTNAPMVADPDMSGFYDVVVKGAERHEFKLSGDAGTDSVDNRKQAQIFTMIDNRGTRVAPSKKEGLSVKDLKQLKSEILDELKDVLKELFGGLDIGKSVEMPVVDFSSSEKAIIKAFKSLDDKFITVKSEISNSSKNINDKLLFGKKVDHIYDLVNFLFLMEIQKRKLDKGSDLSKKAVKLLETLLKLKSNG